MSSLAGLSVVVQTIFQSIPDMTNIALLLIIIMLVLSVAGVSLFGRDFPDDFGNLGLGKNIVLLNIKLLSNVFQVH